MECVDEALLQMLLDGTLDDAEAALVQAHLEGCPGCRRKAAEYKQLLWDLEHPANAELPEELHRMQTALLAAWQEQQRAERAERRRAKTLLPAWAGYSVQWTRHLPTVNRIGELVTKAGSRLVRDDLPRLLLGRRRRK